MDFSKNEEKILKFWKDNGIFKKSLDKEAPRGDFVFYEGPPTANGRPGIHHVEARAFKDLIPRFKTMRGFRVLRKAGWDTHGLPVEIEVEKKLGFKGKKDIEEYGIEDFNKKCRDSVWEYKEDWEKMTERIGFWIDMENPYITYSTDYIETLWWIIKTAHEKKFLYKGYKVVPHCPRCGTAISSHEVAQGYKTITEDSVIVKFQITNSPATQDLAKQDKSQIPTYILVWTTTPWTLPGNVALAVGEKLDYVKIKQGEEFFYIAKNLLNKIKGEYKIVEEIKGKKLVGLEYEPLFPEAVKKTDENFKNAFKVYSADFVSVEDGTGVVHTAVMYGVDDYELGEKVGLPKVHTVNLDGTFNERIFKWQGKFVKAVEKEIIKDLEERKLLYKTEKYSHDYPFCWRCDTPLLYYAKDSWYFRMSELRDDLIKNNKKINWIPEYIKDGRFGEWLRDVKDWAISRERYWGTPLPVWQCDKCNEEKVIGSVEEIRKELGGINKLFLIRHAEAENNMEGINNSLPETKKYPLTKEGEKQAEKVAGVLKEAKVDFIFSSPLLRARQTAEAISEKIGIEIKFDDRLREIDLGELNNHPHAELQEFYPTQESRAKNTGHGVESGVDVRKRTEDFLEEINEKYKNKNIVIVSHGDPLQILYGAAQGIDLFDSLKGWYPLKGSLKQVYSKPLDLHRPYIDEVVLDCKCGGKMKRVPEVADCWFDSGSMPFAQFHYPFENKKLIDEEKLFPADFISEAVDQTRGWFYTLLSVSTLLGRGPSFKNVICLGHVLDKNGQKMSKSRGNVVDPMEMIKKYGADTVRWYMYIINQPGDPKRFDEKDLKEARKIFVTLANVLVFYKMFTPLEVVSRSETQVLTGFALDNVLDKWILANLNLLIKEITEGLEKYDVTTSARKIGAFILDLSQWYLRRSRERFKGDDGGARKTLRKVLVDLSKLMAPFAPFIAEHIYQELGGREQSVHLERWPEVRKEFIDEKILEDMKKARQDVSVGLDLRLKAGINVRQPLVFFETPNKFGGDLLEVIKDELNVKEVKAGKEYKLATDLTPELVQEGQARELIRTIQDLRKRKGLVPKDEIDLSVETDEEGEKFIKKVESELKKAANIKSIKFSENNGEEIKINELLLKLKIDN